MLALVLLWVDWVLALVQVWAENKKTSYKTIFTL